MLEIIYWFQVKVEGKMRDFILYMIGGFNGKDIVNC